MNQRNKDLQFFFDQYYDQYVLQAIRLVKDGVIAEDIVQECFIKLWEKDDLTIDENIQGYFRTMIRNKSLDYFRRQQQNLSVVKGTEQLSDLANTPVDSLAYNELVALVNQSIDALPERCRQVFILSRFEEMSYKEIAAHLGISIKTVENQISKALRNLRKQLPLPIYLLFSSSF